MFNELDFFLRERTVVSWFMPQNREDTLLMTDTFGQIAPVPYVCGVTYQTIIHWAFLGRFLFNKVRNNRSDLCPIGLMTTTIPSFFQQLSQWVTPPMAARNRYAHTNVLCIEMYFFRCC
jgi:hypothetical protein